MTSLSPAAYGDALISAAAGLPRTTPALASLLALFPSSTAPSPVYLALATANPDRVVPELRKCRGYLKGEWEEMGATRVKALLFLSRGAEAKQRGDVEGERLELHNAYESYETTATLFLRVLTAVPAGTDSRPYLPVLIQTLLDLRQLAVLADRVASAASTSADPSSSSSPSSSRQQQPHLEATARHLNKAFTACVADRNPDLTTSRKWATYRIVSLLFRTYFRLKALPLCRNVLRALSAAPLPLLASFPRADRVTFRYYTGLLHFLAQDYAPALSDLEAAFLDCHAAAMRQQELILVPLIPLQLLLRGRRPSRHILVRFPRLEALYSPFLTSLAPRPDLTRFAAALGDAAFERALVVKGTYLAVEALRPILLRQVLRRLCTQVLQSTRVKLADVETALRLAGWTPATSDDDGGGGGGDKKDDAAAAAVADGSAAATAPKPSAAAIEVEWLVGSLIARGFVKGYLSHERQMMVLSNTNAFPALRDVAASGGGVSVLGM